MLRNPNFGKYPIDDDPADISGSYEVVDPRVNVEEEVIARIDRRSHKVTGLNFPVSEGNFALKLRKDRTTEVLIDYGFVKVLFVSPPGPCMDYENLPYLCDGHIPTCEPFRGVSVKEAEKGYSPYGCREFFRCTKKWTKKLFK